MWKTRIPYRLIDFSSRIHPMDNYVIGVKRISDSGGAGSWVWIDEYDNIVEVENGYFKHHPTYQFPERSMAGNEMVAIPKFYVRTDGNTRYWISPEPKEGFHLHPAFMSKGKPIEDIVPLNDTTSVDQAEILIGKWQSWIDWYGIIDDKQKMYSMPSWSEARIAALEASRPADVGMSEAEKNALRVLYPSVNFSFWQNWHAADAWNDHEEDGPVNVNGFHMMNIWEWSALQVLALIEGRTTDVQTAFGEGYCKEVGLDAVDGEVNRTADFHGIYGLWGNVWQWIQGVQTYYNGHLYIWDNLGNEIWKDTGKLVPMRSGDYELWSPGETCGYWKNRVIASGYNYDTTDMFIPDVESLVSDYSRASFSDGVWGRTKSASKYLYACAVGGSYDSGNWCGLFGWNFNVRLGNEFVKDGIRQEDTVWAYPSVASRLCFSQVNIAQEPSDQS